MGRTQNDHNWAESLASTLVATVHTLSSTLWMQDECTRRNQALSGKIIALKERIAVLPKAQESKFQARLNRMFEILEATSMILREAICETGPESPRTRELIDLRDVIADAVGVETGRVNVAVKKQRKKTQKTKAVSSPASILGGLPTAAYEKVPLRNVSVETCAVEAPSKETEESRAGRKAATLNDIYALIDGQEHLATLHPKERIDHIFRTEKFRERFGEIYSRHVKSSKCIKDGCDEMAEILREFHKYHTICPEWPHCPDPCRLCEACKKAEHLGVFRTSSEWLESKSVIERSAIHERTEEAIGEMKDASSYRPQCQPCAEGSNHRAFNQVSFESRSQLRRRKPTQLSQINAV